MTRGATGGPPSERSDFFLAPCACGVLHVLLTDLSIMACASWTNATIADGTPRTGPLAELGELGCRLGRVLMTPELALEARLAWWRTVPWLLRLFSSSLPYAAVGAMLWTSVAGLLRRR